MVTAGDSLAILNSKDVILKTYNPPNYLMSHNYASHSEDALTLPKYSQIRYTKVVT
jgi:hypothetical protein